VDDTHERARSPVSTNTKAATPRTSPDQETTGWPPGIPYIVGNEACERFSYYGMHSILYVYMAGQLYRQHAQYTARAEDLATAHIHLFTAGAYALPMVGAIVADRFLGKYRTILLLSLVYCLGHAVLSATEGSLLGLWFGLGLIAVGSGGIKPCVSAHVGDQFGRGNWFRLRSVYQIFYFTINFGSTFSFLVIPWVFDFRRTETGFLKEHAVSLAFGIPGVLMLLATIAFFMGRNVFVHVPPSPGGKLGLLDTLASLAFFMAFGHLFFTGGLEWWIIVAATLAFLAIGGALFAIRQRREADDGFLAVMLYTVRARLGLVPDALGSASAPGQGLASDDDLARSRFFAPAVERFGADAARGPHAVLKIMSIFVMVPVFWALFDQNATSWVRQAQLMRTVTLFGLEVRPAQVQALNSVLVMLLIPLMNSVGYPLVEKLGFRATALRRMTAGMIIASLSYVSVALIQREIDRSGPGTVSILWQVVPYFIITLAEVLVSITGLEFAYSQAPKRMKSTIMGFWLLSIAIGNVFVSLLAEFGRLPLVQFFWVFAGLMLLSGAMFGLRAHFYVERDLVQE
jgi:POT family proton-dependent oligopeptide transporter